MRMLRRGQSTRGTILPRPNHQFEKRQRELAKKKKKEEKRLRKLERKTEKTTEDSPSPAADSTDAEDPTA
jgi:hypothetical protein